MTRRGSIAYYLAAVVCGSFFLAVSYYGYFLWMGASSQHWARDFLFIYAVTIPLALLPQMLAAWTLRRLARGLPRRVWIWLSAGTVIWIALLWFVGQIGTAVHAAKVSPEWSNIKVAVMLVLVGPMYVAQQPLWIPLPAAAATAWVLYRVHRAFEERT